MSIFVACVHPGSQSPPETGFYREKFSKNMGIGEVDMLWSAVAPEGDYFYLGGTIERQYKNEPSSLVFHRVTKVDGRIVMTKEERQQTKGMANVYGLAADGTHLFASGYQPDKAGNQEAFIAKLNSGLDYIDFKKISLHPENSTAGLLRLQHFQRVSTGRIYAVGFTNVIGTAGFNQDWYLVAVDDLDGKLVREVVTFTPSMGYPCDDEANDIWVDETGVYVIGQANVGCENSVPPYTVVLKFDHELNYLGNFSYANRQGYGIVADCINGAMLHPFYGCVVSGINPDYTDGAFSAFDVNK